MPIVDLDAIPLVPVAFMNEDHHEQARLLNALGRALLLMRTGDAGGGEVEQRFAAFHRHTRTHFAREESEMQRAGFPPYPVHRSEHDHVLAEMTDEGRRFLQRRDVERLWSYVSQAVPNWFVGHIESLDLVTARFFAGGAAAREAVASAAGRRVAVARIVTRSRR